ncbi:hypothetical protein CL653_03590 [bacterium]|nr:hypothetical protein [bacterium]
MKIIDDLRTAYLNAIGEDDVYKTLCDDAVRKTAKPLNKNFDFKIGNPIKLTARVDRNIYKSGIRPNPKIVIGMPTGNEVFESDILFDEGTDKNSEYVVGHQLILLMKSSSLDED